MNQLSKGRSIRESSLWDKVELYIISLSILFFLVTILTLNIPIYVGKDARFIGVNKLIGLNIIPIISLFLGVFSLKLTKRFKYKLKGSKNSNCYIVDIENINYQHLGFLTTYIVPILCLDFKDINTVMMIVALLCIIGTIYVKTNIFYSNPTLALLGYHIYKVRLKIGQEEETDIVLISRDKLVKDEYIQYKVIDEKIFYAKGIQYNERYS